LGSVLKASLAGGNVINNSNKYSVMTLGEYLVEYHEQSDAEECSRAVNESQELQIAV